MYMKKSSGELSGILSVLLNGGLLALIVLYLMLYLAVALIWVLIMENFFSQLAGNLAFTQTMSTIDIIIGFVYFLWLKGAMEGYSDGPIKYRRFLFQLTSFASKLFYLLSELRREGRKDKEESPTIPERLWLIKTSLQALIFYGYEFFDASSPDGFSRAVNTSSDVDPEIRRTFARATGSHSGEKGSLHVSMDLIGVILCEIKGLEREGEIGAGDITLVSDELRSVEGTIRDIDSATGVAGPTIFRWHIDFILFVWFGVWIPVTLWVTFGFATTLVIYPIIMFVLTGIVIYRSWMGGPFDPMSPIKLNDYDAWKSDSFRRIEESAPIWVPKNERIFVRPSLL